MLNIKILARFSSDILIKNKNIRFASRLPQTQQQNKDDIDVKKPDVKTELDNLSKKSKDNFLMEFRDRVPSYDQLFEYKIDEKPHMASKPISKATLSPDFLIKLHRQYDFSFDGIIQWTIEMHQKNLVQDQSYIIRRHGILGPDLAVSHFVTSRGGKVRFMHMPGKWILDDKDLPGKFDKKFRVLSLDASNISLVNEGLDNFILLNDIEELHLRNNKLDDFSCDKIARIFRNSQTLEYLDLSGNKDISHCGVEALYKIRSLKRLIIKNTKASNYPFMELLIDLFQDILPECRIIYR